MRAKDLMTTPVVTVQPDTAAKEAARLLAAHGFTALPVVDGDDTIVGIVTEADLMRGRILPDPRSLIGDTPPTPQEPAAPLVADVMTADPVSVGLTADAVAVTQLMLERHLRALPVADAGRLAGIVTRRDLLRVIARDDDDIARDVRHRLTAAFRQPWEVEVVDGVASISSANPDPEDRHIAEVIAGALPGVRAVRLVVPPGPT